MNTTISMWLGIAFLGLVIAAVLLQAWLWGPKFWDEEAKKTRAPKFWLRMHALCGYTYGAIYVVMMWNMLPRLWEYQYELPARTVFHAVVGITIGVLLICKIMILVFFRHFEESMPYYGFGLLLCTVILTILSVPYALQAHDLLGKSSDPENLARVERLLGDVEFETEVDVAGLVTSEALSRGRTLLVKKCAVCHDMRTILTKPRTPQAWYDVSVRMLDKPSVFGEQLDIDEIPYVTAYLTAITPEIQASTKRRRAEERAGDRSERAIVAMVHEADAAPVPVVDQAEGETLLGAHCTQCHELDEVDDHGGDDLAGWRSVVAAMVAEGAEYDDETAAKLAAYLAQKYPAKPGSEPPLPPAAKDEMPEASPDSVEPVAEGDSDATEAAAAEPDDTVDDGKAEADTKPDVPPTEPKPKPKSKAPAKPKPRAPKPAEGPKADAANGRAIFMAKCKTCHGGNGSGDTPFGQQIGIKSLIKAPLSRAAVKSKIADGVPGTKMKGYRDSLSAQELDDVTAFVKRL
jgi:mono/diheme cytochrome c family protein